MSESETWRNVADFEGLYKISNKGNVHSVERVSSQGNKCGGFTLKPTIASGGYLQVKLYENGIRKHKYIHRIVAEAFIPNPNNYPEINHKDEDKTNNYVENLEWCTRKYNVNFGTAIERAAQAQSKKVRAVNVETGEVLTFNSAKETGDKGYSSGVVYKACSGVYKSSIGKLIGDGHLYKGHQWSYE